MGDLHEMIKAITAKDIAKVEGVTVRAINSRWNEVFREITFDANANLSPDQVAAISRKTTKVGAKRSAKKQSVSTVSPSPEKPKPEPAKAFTWPTFGLSEFLALVVYSHSVLVLYDLTIIFSMPGFIAGVLIAGLKHAATSIVRKEKFQSFADDALAVAFVLDGLAWYAHYNTFTDALPARFTDQMGQQGAFWAALILGAVVACGAWVALLFIKRIVQSKMFD